MTVIGPLPENINCTLYGQRSRSVNPTQAKVRLEWGTQPLLPV